MITSTSNKRVKQLVLWQTKAKERNRDKVFLAEGLRMFQEVPEDAVLEVYASEGFLKKEGKRLTGKLQQTGYEEVTDEVFARISDTQTPQGILAVVRQPVHELDELLLAPDPLFLVLENLQDPGNMGTILRTGEGAGITGVIINESSVDIFNPKVIRSTMGSIFRVPFVRVPDLREVLRRMHQQGIMTYAAHLKGSVCYDKSCFNGPTAFLVGNEANGLSEEIAACASAYIKIPMEGQVESLNASVAAALLMYEAHRQRHMA